MSKLGNIEATRAESRQCSCPLCLPPLPLHNSDATQTSYLTHRPVQAFWQAVGLHLEDLHHVEG